MTHHIQGLFFILDTTAASRFVIQNRHRLEVTSIMSTEICSFLTYLLCFKVPSLKCGKVPREGLYKPQRLRLASFSKKRETVGKIWVVSEN